MATGEINGRIRSPWNPNNFTNAFVLSQQQQWDLSTVAVNKGGTNITSYATGDLITATGTTTLAKINDVAIGSVLASGGVGVIPSWSSSPTLTGLSISTNTGLRIRDSDATNYITLAMGGNATADRTFTLNGGDANRAITLRGDLSTGNDVSFVGNFASTMTFTGTTSVTFPTSGTLLTSTGLTSGYIPYYTTALTNSLIYEGPGPATDGVAIGGTDVRGVLTVQINNTSTWAANTDPTDSGRFFVMENTSTTGAANQYSNITLQLWPTGSIGGGRCLADIRLVRSALNSTDSVFLFSNFNQSSNYQDVFSLGNSSSYLLSKLFVGGTSSPSSNLQIAAGTTSIAPLIINSGTNLTSAVSGAIENDGTNLYYTSSTPTRQKVLTNYTVGTVLQVLSATKQDTFTTTTALSSGGVVVTGLSVTITPRDANSKFYIICHISCGGSTVGAVYFWIARGSTAIGTGTPSGSRLGCGGRIYYSNADVVESGCVATLDSPATASAVTYNLYASSEGGGATIYVNRTPNDTNNNSFGARTASSITVFEVSA